MNSIVGAHSGATSEAIVYPAAGGGSYGTSVVAGVSAVAKAVNSLAASCPDTQIVLVGYSQVTSPLSLDQCVELMDFQ